MNRFEKRVALVTGGATGIGLATVQRLRHEGAIVYAGVLDITDDLDFAGAEPIRLDVTDAAQWERVISFIVEQCGQIDVLVNNAGIRESNTAENTTPEQWQRLIDTNLKSIFLGCQSVIPHMRTGGGGAIVNVSSINGIRGNRNMIAYSASKGGIISMTASLALDHAADNIRVNAVCPGAIQTTMLEGYIAEMGGDTSAVIERVAASHPLNRAGKPEEVASVIAFLASDDASFMTGISIPVDGGRSMR